ncbi:MAG: pyridoxamine 5'-phosphate oxidase [Lachnospiraceae bacterium]|nr:pyridoxamine 5'-phosphate oxidase [Lachnospiraceae bacterium]
MGNIKEMAESLIENQGVCFLSAVDKNGYPSTKAMLAPRFREGLQVFYLSTNTNSAKVSQYRFNSKACLYFCDSKYYRGVTLQGTVEVLEDKEIKHMVWNKGNTLFYPGGEDDPGYCILKFTSHIGRYYSNFQSWDFRIQNK